MHKWTQRKIGQGYRRDNRGTTVGPFNVSIAAHVDSAADVIDGLRGDTNVLDLPVIVIAVSSRDGRELELRRQLGLDGTLCVTLGDTWMVHHIDRARRSADSFPDTSSFAMERRVFLIWVLAALAEKGPTDDFPAVTEGFVAVFRHGRCGVDIILSPDMPYRPHDEDPGSGERGRRFDALVARLLSVEAQEVSEPARRLAPPLSGGAGRGGDEEDADDAYEK